MDTLGMAYLLVCYYIKNSFNAIGYYPRANGAKRRSGRKPGARVTNSALAAFKVVAHGS